MKSTVSPWQFLGQIYIGGSLSNSNKAEAINNA